MVDGSVVACVEEERLLRYKHAPNVFPVRAIKSCLDLSGLTLSDIDLITYGFDAPRFASGDMARFYDTVNRCYPPDDATLRWQKRLAGLFSPAAMRTTLVSNLVRHFGVQPDQVPELVFCPHHETHAAAAFFLSPCDEALVLTLDGSGTASAPCCGAAPAHRSSSCTGSRSRTRWPGSTPR